MSNDPSVSAAPKRRLDFVLMIETELGEGDEVEPTMRYVCDWLNDNGYGYAVMRGPCWRRARTRRPAPGSGRCRVPDDIWNAAKARAEAEGTTVSAVVQAALRRYAKGATRG